MKELDSFTVERLKDLINQYVHEEYNDVSDEEVIKLVSIALAAKRAEPVINIKFKDGWPVPESVGVVDAGKKLADGYHDFYTTPQLNSPEIPDGWTSSDPANAALVMLDRIDTIDSADDDRIEDIKLIIRQLAAAPEKPLCPMKY
ncbi:TPA: hypothetical protein SJ157_000051 [Yersinia enterocolitica]|nr:hypothetical protein [Yersinia enterocolitica]